jgi:hypothetical protein
VGCCFLSCCVTFCVAFILFVMSVCRTYLHGPSLDGL